MATSLHCTQCGACCSTGPALSLDECFELQDVFVAGLRFQAQHFPAIRLNDAATAAVIEHQKDLFPRIDGGVDGFSHLQIYAIESGYGSRLDTGHGCPARSADGKCSIYERRPSRCRAAPFDPFVPEVMQDRPLHWFVQQGCAKTEDTAGPDTVFADGCISSALYRQAYTQRLEDIRRDAETFAYLAQRMQVGGEEMLPDVRELVEAGKRGGGATTNFLPALVVMHATGARDTAAVLSFLDAQERLITAEIAKAMARKNKAEREITAQLRGTLKVYAYARGMFSA